jgi:hypothetical protein
MTWPGMLRSSQRPGITSKDDVEKDAIGGRFVVVTLTRALTAEMQGSSVRQEMFAN